MPRFPTDYTTLPTISFVVPNLCNDMHDCSIATGDSWLRAKIDGYVGNASIRVVSAPDATTRRQRRVHRAPGGRQVPTRGAAT